MSENQGEQQRRAAELWQTVQEGKLLLSYEIQHAFQEVFPFYRCYYRLLVFGHSSAGAPGWETAAEELRPLLPDCHLFVPEGAAREMTAIQFFDQQPFGHVGESDELADLLRNNHLSVMISNATRDYGRMKMLHAICSRAGQLADLLNVEPQVPVRFYERYSMYVVIDLCAQRYTELWGHADILYLVHPIVVHLTRYDNQRGTNLRDVLYRYLASDRNLKATAEALYMHRNTVLNKLNQIRSICPVDFEDGGLNQRLLFSCQLALYYERVLGEDPGRE